MGEKGVKRCKKLWLSFLNNYPLFTIPHSFFIVISRLHSLFPPTYPGDNCQQGETLTVYVSEDSQLLKFPHSRDRTN